MRKISGVEKELVVYWEVVVEGSSSEKVVFFVVLSGFPDTVLPLKQVFSDKS